MIVLIIILGFVFRLISLNQSLWIDEATSVLVARDFSIIEILTKFSPGDFHPPLYYLILKLWLGIFGSTEVSARMMSVLFGVATIWMVYKITKIIFNFQFSIFNYLPALLLATSGLHIYYSQEARMYSMETFLSTLATYFVLKKNFFWLTITSVALLYTDYLPVFLLASFLVFLIIYERKYLKQIIGWVIGTVVLFTPWIPTFLVQLNSGILVKQNAPLWWATLGKTNIKELLLVPIKFIIGRISFDDKLFYSGLVLAVSAPFIISIIKSFQLIKNILFLWFWFVGPLILVVIFGFFFTGFSYFRLTFILPAFYLLVAYGIISIKKKLFKWLLIMGILIINLFSTSIYLFNPKFHRENWRGAVSWIEKNSTEKSSITLFISSGQQEAYRYYAKSTPLSVPEVIDKSSFDKIWLMRYAQPIFDPQDAVRQQVEERGYRKLAEKDFNGVVVWEYVK